MRSMLKRACAPGNGLRTRKRAVSPTLYSDFSGSIGSLVPGRLLPEHLAFPAGPTEQVALVKATRGVADAGDDLVEPRLFRREAALGWDRPVRFRAKPEVIRQGHQSDVLCLRHLDEEHLVAVARRDAVPASNVAFRVEPGGAVQIGDPGPIRDTGGEGHGRFECVRSRGSVETHPRVPDRLSGRELRHPDECVLMAELHVNRKRRDLAEEPIGLVRRRHRCGAQVGEDRATPAAEPLPYLQRKSERDIPGNGDRHAPPQIIDAFGRQGPPGNMHGLEIRGDERNVGPDVGLERCDGVGQHRVGRAHVRREDEVDRLGEGPSELIADLVGGCLQMVLGFCFQKLGQIVVVQDPVISCATQAGVTVDLVPRLVVFAATG